jgi:hypothetical protein
MEKIKSIKELRDAIMQLESKQLEDKRLLKEQFMVTYEAMKPVNLIKNTIKDLITSPDLKSNLFSAFLGIAAGYLSKRATFGLSPNPLKNILGSFLQLGVSNVVTKKSGGIKSFLLGLARKISSKRKVNGDYQFR